MAGRRPIGERPMTAAERQRRRREALKAQQPHPKAARKASPEVPPLDPATVSASTRERMEAWQRGETKRIREQVRAEIRSEIEKEFDAYVKSVSEQVARAKRIEAARDGYLTRSEFNKILKCVHPDRVVSQDERIEAFRLFNPLKDVLVKSEPQLAGPPLPQTVADLMARRKTKQEQRAAKKAAPTDT